MYKYYVEERDDRTLVIFPDKTFGFLVIPQLN